MKNFDCLIELDLILTFAVDNCSPNPCKNSGVCSDDGISFSCNCDGTGYTGDTCETIGKNEIVK